jgi:hypothetical protein
VLPATLASKNAAPQGRAEPQTPVHLSARGMACGLLAVAEEARHRTHVKPASLQPKAMMDVVFFSLASSIHVPYRTSGSLHSSKGLQAQGGWLSASVESATAVSNALSNL